MKKQNNNKKPENIQELLIKRMPIGFILWDTKFRVKQWNLAAQKIFGFSQKEALGKHPYDFIVPKSAQKQVTDVWKRLLKGDLSANSVNENFTKSGKVIICDWINTPIKKRDGSIVGVLSTIQDITKRKKDEESLKEYQRRLAEIIEFLPDATFVLDLSGKVVAWNRAVEKMTKTKVEDVLGKGNYTHAIPFYGKRRPVLADLILQPKLYAKIEKNGGYPYITKEGEVLVTERFLTNVGGKDIYVWAKAAPLYDVQGKLSGVVEAVRDITKEKELDKAKTEFISLASHQLRTPLSSIKWTLEAFDEKDKLNQKNKERFEDLYKSNERLISLVNNLLNITRIESGKLKIIKKNVDLLKLFRDCGCSYKKKILDKKQRVSFLVKGKIGKVDIDPVMMSEAFCNILDNAITYGYEKSKITVILKKDKENYMVSVHNFGPAITEPEKEKIFSKFYRGPGAPIRNFAGVGLGLFFTKATIEANGGKIWFESKDKKGTTFYFTIPVK